jgi:hypothetical protein
VNESCKVEEEGFGIKTDLVMLLRFALFLFLIADRAPIQEKDPYHSSINGGREPSVLLKKKT